MATPAPTRIGGHTYATSPKAVVPTFAQQIDGKTYSTRRAELVLNNGKGEILYRDPEAGYFLVFVSRFIGAVPMYSTRPLSDHELNAWATKYGARTLISKASAKVLVKKLLASSGGSNELRKLMRTRI